MKVKIEFDCDNAAFEDNFTDEFQRVLKQAGRKAVLQLGRPACVCNHLEAADKLLDSNGNTVGTVTVER